MNGFAWYFFALWLITFILVILNNLGWRSSLQKWRKTLSLLDESQEMNKRLLDRFGR